MTQNIVIVTIKSWNITNFDKLNNNKKQNQLEDYEFFLINKKEDLTYEKLKEINPKYVFFPHWSWIIPKQIYENFECIVFHMTDLPFGRGGSPLQNLISRNIYKTKISAIKVVKELDAGDIYCKEPLDLSQGSAEDIFRKASETIFNKMIPFILKNNPTPKKQEGEIIEFKRRTPEQSDISKLSNLKKIYDNIRMLNAEGYPKAFVETENIKIEFQNAKINNKDNVIADCIITLKNRSDKNG